MDFLTKFSKSFSDSFDNPQGRSHTFEEKLPARSTFKRSVSPPPPHNIDRCNYILFCQWVDKLRKNVTLHNSLSKIFIIVGQSAKSQSSCLLNLGFYIKKKRSQKSHRTWKPNIVKIRTNLQGQMNTCTQQHFTVRCWVRRNCMQFNWSLLILFNQTTGLHKPFSARHRAIQKLHRYIPVSCMIMSLVLVTRRAVSAWKGLTFHLIEDWNITRDFLNTWYISCESSKSNCPHTVYTVIHHTDFYTI